MINNIKYVFLRSVRSLEFRFTEQGDASI